jgi:hypothetical protein
MHRPLGFQPALDELVPDADGKAVKIGVLSGEGKVVSKIGYYMVLDLFEQIYAVYANFFSG